MVRVVLVVALVGMVGAGCGGGASCDLPEQWSVANSGGLCQVNFFNPEHAVYCSGASGSWDCACGPAAENPMRFTSADFCDLEGEERACQAVEQCGF
jgi:hypothetical protein